MSDICAHIARPEAYTLTLSGDRQTLGKFISLLEKISSGWVEADTEDRKMAAEIYNQVSFFRG